MGKWLLVLFTVVPLVEFYLLMYVGSLIGFWPTVGIVLLTGIVGASLAKREGLRAMQQWQRDLGEGRVPKDGVLGGLMILVGGVLLVTPGVLTDAIGLSLLFPLTRRLFVRFAQARLERGIADGSVQVMGGFGTSRTASPFDGPFAGGPFTGMDDFFGPFGGSGSVAGAIVEVDGEEVPVETPELPSDDSELH